ncbi:MAG: PilZ domain-containing protein [Deltaproteobacteria bacterium]|nr:PilZ domain-containing protein [Deltaproteobacteria bacterium]
MEDEKRRFSRFILNMNATLYVKGDSFKTDMISNLSIGGCLLPIHADLEPNDPCSIIINLGMPESDVNVKVEGIIIRCEHGDVAVKFTSIDPDSLFHLQMLARYNSPDTEKVEEEIKKHPGLF